MKENPKPFIPAWLNTAGLSQADFRTYCCLAARADIKTGIAWPQADTIAKDCFMAKNTVWKSLKSLEAAKFIRRVGKPFAGSNRYLILVPPIGANEIPVDSTIGANEMPIEAAPIGANEILHSAQMDSHQSAQMDSRESKPKKVNQRK
jgi:Helix-turn-helix domain